MNKTGGSSIRRDGALAMARGCTSLSIDVETNKKLARFSANGEPKFVIQLDVDILQIWLAKSSADAAFRNIAHLDRRLGVQKDGSAAKPDLDGMHSGLRPFFKTEELTCFSPTSLDEAWILIRGMAGD
jgi:hypothetical protein